MAAKNIRSKWIESGHQKPEHTGLVLVAMWREKFRDYAYFVAAWDFDNECWRQWGFEEFDLEKNCQCPILYWSEIVEAPRPRKKRDA